MARLRLARCAPRVRGAGRGGLDEVLEAAPEVPFDADPVVESGVSGLGGDVAGQGHANRRLQGHDPLLDGRVAGIGEGGVHELGADHEWQAEDHDADHRHLVILADCSGTTKFRVFGTTSLNRSSRAGARGTLVVARFPAKNYRLELKARGGSTVPAKGKKPGTLQYDVSVNRSGKKDKIKFAVPTNLPAGIKASFKPQSSAGNATVLTFSNSNKKPVPLWPFTVSGTSGNYNIDVFKQSVEPEPSRLTFATQPPASANIAAAGTGSFPVVVRVLDANGNLVPSDNSTQVTLAIGTNPAAGALTCSGGLTATASGGSASFNGCAITKAGNGYTLNASSSPSFSAPTNANAFNIVAGSAAAIALAGSNADLTVGGSRVFTATIRDANGNVIATGSDSTASVSFAQSGGSGSVSGAGAPAANGGVATRSLTGGSPGAVTLVAQVSLSGGVEDVERDRLQRRVRRGCGAPVQHHRDGAEPDVPRRHGADHPRRVQQPERR